MNRRTALHSLVMLGAASAAPVIAQPVQELRVPAGRGGPDDEAFWGAVRQQFEPAAGGRSNLVTVVRGVTPRAIREQIAAESIRHNTFGPMQPADPEWRARLNDKMAAFIGAPAGSVALLRNTTEGVTTVLSNWPLSRGDEILTSSADHGQFYDTLAYRAARDGVVPRTYHLPAPTSSMESSSTPSSRRSRRGRSWWCSATSC